MFAFTHPTARAATVAATLLGTIVLASPLFAGGDLSQAAAAKSPAAQMILAQTAAEAMTTPASAEAVTASSDRIEARIKELHRKLHVTPAQVEPWNNLAQVMRDNAKTMVDLQNQRVADTQSMSAVDSVKSYASVIRAHQVGMDKFIPAFTALYDSMSDAQKKTADSMFRSRARAEERKESKKIS